MDAIDTVVIGAGVVGLAVARALARAGREVVILEAESIVGSGVSSRNSEVIHAGIYYPKDSAKARMCVAGRDALYAYCASRNVPHKKLGKLIVATNDAEVAQLERIAAAGAGNGVDDLQWLSGEEARALEPALNATAAILSPSTGIVDSHALMLSYLGEAGDAGAAIAFETKLTRAAIELDGIVLWVNGEAEPALKARLVVNAAGLSALDLARATEGYAADVPSPKQFAKGSYFALAGRAPFSHLIYPAPEPGGLGVHLTLDLAGQGKFGPDVEWVNAIDYDVDPARGEKFYAAVRKYWPGLKDGALTPAYSGVRPKIVGQGEPAGDFVIAGPETHGAAGLINLFGIESPGLTSSLAIANEVARLAEDL